MRRCIGCEAPLALSDVGAKCTACRTVHAPKGRVYGPRENTACGRAGNTIGAHRPEAVSCPECRPMTPDEAMRWLERVGCWPSDDPEAARRTREAQRVLRMERHR